MTVFGKRSWLIDIIPGENQVLRDLACGYPIDPKMILVIDVTYGRSSPIFQDL
jgi:hypothetical protein